MELYFVWHFLFISLTLVAYPEYIFIPFKPGVLRELCSIVHVNIDCLLFICSDLPLYTHPNASFCSETDSLLSNWKKFSSSFHSFFFFSSFVSFRWNVSVLKPRLLISMEKKAGVRPWNFDKKLILGWRMFRHRF